MAAIYLFFHMFINEPFWSRLNVRILLYFAHADEVRKADYHTYYHTYKRVLIGRRYKRSQKSK